MEYDALLKENRRLQLCLNDLVSVMALPAVWVGRESVSIADSLLDSLQPLIQADVLYLRANTPAAGSPSEWARAEEADGAAVDRLRAVAAMPNADWPERLSGSIRICAVPLGLRGELGMLVVGARREGFPADSERLLLGVVANLASVAFLSARHLAEERQAAERRQAALNQQTQEFLLQGVAESIAAPLVFLKPDGEIEVINNKLLSFFGKTRDEMAGWQSSEVIHPEDRPATIDALKRAIETGAPYEVEARRRRVDGTYRWWRSNGYPMWDESGNIVRWCVLYTDIEDRKRAEADLAESERELERIINTIPAMAWSANPDGTCDFFNRHHLNYVDRELHEMTGIGFVSTFHPDDIEHLMAAWKVMLESGRGGEVEGRVRRFDGEYRWCLFITNPLRDAEGRLVKWFGVNIDIEDRRRADEKLRASEFNLRQQTETIPQMLWSATAEGNIDYCNERLLEYSGLTAETVMNGGWVNLLHPDDRESTAKVWMRCIATGAPYTVEVRQFHAAAESYRWVLTTALPLRDDKGRIIKWYGSCVDIHDRKQAEDALRASGRDLAQILSSIPAHAWTAKADGSAEFINQHYLDYIGMTIEEAAGLGWTTAVHPDDLGHLIVTWQALLSSLHGGEAEARMRRADGEYRWFLFRSVPLFDDAGNLVKWFGINVDIEDRKRAEDALRASELNLRQQTETIPQMLWSAQPDGAFDYCNTRFLDYTGSRSRGVMGSGWKDALHPDDQEPTARAWRHAVTTGEPYQVEVRKFCAAAGAYHWCLTTALPLRDADGRIVKWHGSSVDIHDRKMAEEALRASARDLAQIINTIPGFTWTARPDGTAEFLSKHYLDYVGLSFEEATGSGWAQAVHPDDLESLLATWRAALTSSLPGEAVARLRRRKGEYRWFLFRYNPFFDNDGRLVKWFGVNIDIEDRKRAEEALRASERNFRGLTESIPQMLWRTTPDGLVDYGNSRFLEYTGYTAPEIMGRDWIRILHPDDVARTERVWGHAVATGEPYHIEYRVRRAADNAYRWCLVTALPLRDEDGSIMKWHGCCIDVHDWKMAQDELRETQSELAHVTRVMTMGQLTASIAHELNQPLSGIMTNAGTGMRMLSGDPPNVQGAMETVRRTLRDAQRASDVITRLRALFSRKTAAPEIVDINAAAQEVVALASNELQRKGARLTVDLCPNLPTLMGDRVQLQQVILNLILNGAEAMEAVDGRPRVLTMSTALDRTGDIRVAIRDSGTGFDTGKLERLFSPFFTTKGSGMGIGLSVSRTIVESHKGRLWAENNDGAGATFCFSIPSTMADPPA